MRADLPEIIHAVASAPGIRTVGLTTNGLKLAGCAHQLRQAGVTNINVSLDSLDFHTYERVTGTNAVAAALDGLMAAVGCGFDSVKTNTVVMRGVNAGEICAIAALAHELPIEARFIELMPLEGSEVDWGALFVPAQEIRGMLGELAPVPAAESSTAKAYRTPGAKGRIGIIAPVTERFCEGCNRVRLTCSGLLKPCLRLPDSYDISRIIHGPDAEGRLRALLEHAQMVKQNALSQMEAGIPACSMSSIGG